jgi:hypothetical protein
MREQYGNIEGAKMAETVPNHTECLSRKLLVASNLH